MEEDSRRPFSVYTRKLADRARYARWQIATALHRLSGSLEPSGEERVLFQHIPKTGGSSLREVLAAHFPSSAVSRFENWHAVAAAPAETLQPLRLLSAHFRSGWEARLAPVFFDRKILRVTMLRDPVARVVSHYHYFRSIQGPIPEDDRLAIEAARQGSLLDFVCDERPEVSRHVVNLQTWLLSEAPEAPEAPEASDADGGDDLFDPRLLDSALENLAGCDLVAVTEDMEGAAKLVAHMLGARRAVRPPHRNRTEGRPASVLDQRVRAEIARRTALDEQLYAAARNRFHALQASVHAEQGRTQGSGSLPST